MTFPFRRLMLLLVLAFSMSPPLQAHDAWQDLVNALDSKEPDLAPWNALPRWVDDGALANGVVEKTAREGDRAARAFALAIMMRRGFDEQAVILAAADIARRDPTVMHIVSRWGDRPGVQALEAALKEVPDRDEGRELAALLWRGHASEAARAWLLERYDRADPGEALILAETGLIDEVRPTLDRLRAIPSVQGDAARRLLSEDLAVRHFGGPREKELKEFKILYQEARTVLQKLVDGHRNFQFNEEGHRILQQAWATLQRERRYRELFSESYESFQRGEMLLWELLLDIQDLYVDDNKADPLKLIEAAAQGIMSALDRHCSYLGVEATRRSEERFSGNYVGIGAIVSKTPTGTILIESTFFGAPAWSAGIRSGDQITEVLGESVIPMSLNDAVALLRGEPGTRVTVQVIRTGWDKPVDIQITREAINTPSLFVEQLPGGIGYAKLTQFIATSDRDLINEVQRLRSQLAENGSDLKGLILDLRDNGGGYLHTAVNICDQFLEGDKLIVYTEGRNPAIAPRDERRSTPKGEFKDLPLVILVNRGSASASEVVSGCMRDHDRAVIIGERTFGKGSVQNLIALDSLDAEARLRLTIAYYYLPSGESIHHRPGIPGGIMPDVASARTEETSDAVRDLIRIQEEDGFNRYVREILENDKDTLVKLATGGLDPKLYPDFEKWYTSLKTEVDPKTVLTYLRGRIRTLASEEIGRHLVADFVTDEVLQDGIREISKKTKVDLAKIPEYAILKTD